MFWVISVHFYIRNTLPKSGTFLLGHPVYRGSPTRNPPVYIGCPTTYLTRHFFNNSKTNEDISTKQTHTADTFLFISHTTNVLLFRSHCNIFICFKIIKEMPGLVGSGTPCIIRFATTLGNNMYNIKIKQELWLFFKPIVVNFTTFGLRKSPQ